MVLKGRKIFHANDITLSSKPKPMKRITAGKKILCFRKDSDNEKAPAMDLVFVTYNE